MAIDLVWGEKGAAVAWTFDLGGLTLGMLDCLLVAQYFFVLELEFDLVKVLSLKRTKSLRFKWLASAVRTLRFQLFHFLDTPRAENLFTVRTF